VSPERVVFIDPRGYFGTTDLFGDVAYDWAKLLYSVMTKLRTSLTSGDSHCPSCRTEWNSR